MSKPEGIVAIMAEHEKIRDRYRRVAKRSPSGRALLAAGYQPQPVGGNLWTWCKEIDGTLGRITISTSDAGGVPASGDPCRAIWITVTNSASGDDTSDETPRTLTEAISVGDTAAAAYRAGIKPKGTLPDPAVLGKAFADVLRGWLTDSQWEDMRCDNRRFADAGETKFCASGDYCDSNMAMDAAIRDLTGVTEIDLDDAAMLTLWNEAWMIAKRDHLTAPKVTP